MTAATLEERMELLESKLQQMQKQLAQQPSVKNRAGGGLSGSMLITPISRRQFASGRNGATPIAPMKTVTRKCRCIFSTLIT